MVSLNGRARNYIFLVFLSVSVIALMIARLIAVDQDSQKYAEYQKYLSARKLVADNKGAEAEPIFTELVNKYPDSSDLLWFYGTCLARNGKLEKGLEYMDLARQAFPGNATIPSYLVGYGQILYEMGEFDKAEYYFKECLKHKDEDKEGHTKVAEQYLEMISSKKTNS